jgi:hypothetical protein
MIAADVRLLEHEVKAVQAQILEHELTYLTDQLNSIATQSTLLAALVFFTFNIQMSHMQEAPIVIQLATCIAGPIALVFSLATLTSAVFVSMWGCSEALRSKNEAHLRSAIVTFREERDFTVRLFCYALGTTVISTMTVGFLYWGWFAAVLIVMLMAATAWGLFIIYSRIKARFILCPTIFPDGFLHDDVMLFLGKWDKLKNLSLHHRSPFSRSHLPAFNHAKDHRKKNQEFDNERLSWAREKFYEKPLNQGKDKWLMEGWLSKRCENGMRKGVWQIFYFRFNEFHLSWYKSLEPGIVAIESLSLNSGGPIVVQPINLDASRMKTQKESGQEHHYQVLITIGGRKLRLSCESEEDRDRWMTAFVDVGAQMASAGIDHSSDSYDLRSGNGSYDLKSSSMPRPRAYNPPTTGGAGKIKKKLRFASRETPTPSRRAQPAHRAPVRAPSWQEVLDASRAEDAATAAASSRTKRNSGGILRRGSGDSNKTSTFGDEELDGGSLI